MGEITENIGPCDCCGADCCCIAECCMDRSKPNLLQVFTYTEWHYEEITNSEECVANELVGGFRFEWTATDDSPATGCMSWGNLTGEGTMSIYIDGEWIYYDDLYVISVSYDPFATSPPSLQWRFDYVCSSPGNCRQTTGV